MAAGTLPPAAPAWRTKPFFLLMLLAAALALGTAGWGDLYNETDGQYGGAAKIMAQGGSWLVPENAGIPRLVKPPLLYWEMAAAMKIFGVTPFAARLPGALALVALTAATFLIGERMGGLRRGMLAGGILVTLLGWFSLGRIVMPEQTLSALIAWALYCVLRGMEDPARRGRWFLAFWICASLASFVKGWHGTLYPLAIAGLVALACRDARPQLRGLLSWQGLLVFLAINLPWHLAIELRYPGWFHNLIFTEHLGHVEGNSSPATDYTSVPRWQFLLLHLAWFFPWSVVAGVALVANRKKILSLLPRIFFRFDATLVAAWAVVVFGSVMLTGQRQDYYAMAMWPAFALGAAWVLERFSPRPGAMVLTGVLAVALAGSFFPGAPTPAAETGALAERATAWTTLAGFDPTVWASLRTTAWFALGGGFFCAAAAVKSAGKPLAWLGACAIFLGLGAVSGMAIVSPYFSLARMAPSIPPGSTVVYDGGIDTGSSLLFYTDARVLLLDQNPEEEFIVRKFGLGRDRFLNSDELGPLWQADPAWLFVTEAASLPEWEQRLNRKLTVVSRCGTQVLLRN
jgi:4-amino-4-deoxy-L-arabinose transferase-like glycosyltransferase